MSQNLKAFLQEETCYNANDLIRELVEAIPGRSVGERYVVKASYAGPTSILMELDDGCVFKMTCEKII